MGGRPKKIKTQVKDWIAAHPMAVAELMQALYDKGIKGDRESAMYVIDRIKGRPKQQTEIDVLKKIVFAADDYELIARAQLDEKKLLAEYKEEDTEKDTMLGINLYRSNNITEYKEGEGNATEQRGSQGIHEEV